MDGSILSMYLLHGTIEHTPLCGDVNIGLGTLRNMIWGFVFALPAAICTLAILSLYLLNSEKKREEEISKKIEGLLGRHVRPVCEPVFPVLCFDKTGISSFGSLRDIFSVECYQLGKDPDLSLSGREYEIQRKKVEHAVAPGCLSEVMFQIIDDSLRCYKVNGVEVVDMDTETDLPRSCICRPLDVSVEDVNVEVATEWLSIDFHSMLDEFDQECDPESLSQRDEVVRQILDQLSSSKSVRDLVGVHNQIQSYLSGQPCQLHSGGIIRHPIPNVVA